MNSIILRLDRIVEKLKSVYRKNRSRLHAAGVLLLVGVIYVLVITVTDWYLPCPIRSITGFVCPGCGISHFFIDLLHLDFYSAFRQNIGLSLLLILWGLYGIFRLIFRPKNRKVFNGLTFFSVGVMLLFGVLRNIPVFSFLLPLYLQ